MITLTLIPDHDYLTSTGTRHWRHADGWPMTDNFNLAQAGQAKGFLPELQTIIGGLVGIGTQSGWEVKYMQITEATPITLYGTPENEDDPAPVIGTRKVLHLAVDLRARDAHAESAVRGKRKPGYWTSEQFPDALRDAFVSAFEKLTT